MKEPSSFLDGFFRSMKRKESVSMEQLEELFSQAVREIEQVNIPLGNYEKQVYINRRAKTRWGACKTIVKRGILGRKKTVSHQIEIAEFLLKKGSRQDILNTLIHELLHTCKGCQNHGKQWKQYAALMNETYGYRIQTVTAAEEKEGTDLKEERRLQAKYMVQCAGCGQTVYRMKKSKLVMHPEQYCCRKCGGKLFVKKL